MPGDMPDWYKRSFTSSSEMEQEKGNVDENGVTLTFSKSVHSWIIYNDGPSAVHFDLTGAVSTNSFKIPPRAGFMLDVPTDEIFLICATGQTTTVYAIGVR